MWIAFEHLLGDWLTNDSLWFAKVLLLYLEILGNTTFLFFAGVNITLKWRFARLKGANWKPFFIATVQKMMALLFISICSNFVLSIYYGDGVITWEFSSFFRYTVLQCLAFSVIIAAIFVKMNVWGRLMAAILILTLSLPTYQYLASIRAVSATAKAITVAIFDPYFAVPLFPMVAYTIVGSVAVDFLLPYKYPSMKENEEYYGEVFGIFGKRPNMHKSYATYIILFGISALSLMLSLIFGHGPNRTPLFDGVASSWFSALDDHVLITELLGYIPEFLVVNHPINYVYKLSLISVIFCIIFYYFDLVQDESYKPSALSRAWIFMGKISLSYWIYVAAFNLIPIDTNPIVVWPFMIGALSLLSYIFKKNIKYYKGVGLIEWVIIFLSFTWVKVKPRFKK